MRRSCPFIDGAINTRPSKLQSSSAGAGARLRSRENPRSKGLGPSPFGVSGWGRLKKEPTSPPSPPRPPAAKPFAPGFPVAVGPAKKMQPPAHSWMWSDSVNDTMIRCLLAALDCYTNFSKAGVQTRKQAANLPTPCHLPLCHWLSRLVVGRHKGHLPQQAAGAQELNRTRIGLGGVAHREPRAPPMALANAPRAFCCCSWEGDEQGRTPPGMQKILKNNHARTRHRRF